MAKKLTPEQVLIKLRSLATDAQLARWAGCTRQAVSNWRKIPAERVLRLERFTTLTRYQMRPDIYGDGP
ncbi:MAG: YdaS family helix-turn-helix protein [Pseudomonadota bacterium]